MDCITFDSGEIIFRLPEEHCFSAGERCVVSVHAVSLSLPPHLSEKTPATVKNLCGRFTTCLQRYLSHEAVAAQSVVGFFGKHVTMHHLQGTATVHKGVVYFKGCPGFPGLLELSRDLFMDTPRCEVHMGVFKSCLGRRVCTDHGCFLEKCVSRRFGGMRAPTRPLEYTQAVKLKIENFDPQEFPHLTGQLVPSSVDLTVTGSGVLLLRFSWKRCAWTEEAEAAVLRFCDWITGELRDCC